MIEALALKLLLRGPLEWHYLRTKVHQILPSGPDVISGGHTDRQTSDLISLLSFLESILKTSSNVNIIPKLKEQAEVMLLFT
jgi:hypothetical protein